MVTQLIDYSCVIDSWTCQFFYNFFKNSVHRKTKTWRAAIFHFVRLIYITCQISLKTFLPSCDQFLNLWTKVQITMQTLEETLVMNVMKDLSDQSDTAQHTKSLLKINILMYWDVIKSFNQQIIYLSQAFAQELSIL